MPTGDAFYTNRAVFVRTESVEDSRIDLLLIQRRGWRKKPVSMTKPLSLNLRDRVVAAVDDGMSQRQAAEGFSNGVVSVIRWCQCARETGSPKTAPQEGNRHPERIEAERDLMLGIVEQSRDIALIELQAELARRGHSFAVATLWRIFDRHENTWKKAAAHAKEQDRSDVLKHRQNWSDHQVDLDPKRLALIHEIWTSTNVARGVSDCAWTRGTGQTVRGPRRGRRAGPEQPRPYYRSETGVLPVHRRRSSRDVPTWHPLR